MMFNKKVVSIVISIMLSVGLSSSCFASSSISNANVKVDTAISEKLEIQRIAGKNRYETSYKISEALGVYQNMVIASGEDFPDALASGLLASHLKSPVLLTEKNLVNPYLYSALDKHKDQKYYIVGGEASVSKKVKEDIEHFSPNLTNRIYGKDRYKTSEMVAYTIEKDIFGIEYSGDMLAVYAGENYSDALSSTPFMYNYGRANGLKRPATISIEKKRKVDSEILEVIFGGESSLPNVKGSLRLAGSNRYQTSVEVAKAYKTVLKKDIDTIIIASGETYPDALSAGPLASSKNAAILLTESKALNKDVKKYIEDTKSIKNVIIVGGESSVSNQVEKDLDSIVR